MLRILAPRGAALLAGALLGAPVPIDAQGPEPFPLGADLPAFVAPPSAAVPEPAAPPEPVGELRLNDALALVLLRNAELAADSYELRAREAALLQAGALPNPTLSFEVEDVAGSGEFGGVEQAQTTLLLGQLIELGGKRAARTDLAAAERDLAAWDYELRRIDVLAGTAAAFVEVLAAQERLRLADEALALAQSVQRVAALRQRAGLASPAEEIRAGVAADVAGVEREHAEHELATARQQLAAFWSGEAPRFERAEGDLEALPRPPSEAELAQRLDASPGLALWQAERSRRRAIGARARSEQSPDLTLFAGPRRLSGPEETALVLGVSLPLPLWNRNRGAIEEAEQRVAKLAAEQRSARVSVAAELATARVALVASVEESKLLRTRVLPGIERAVAVMRRGYEAGRFAQIEVLDAERARVEAREQYLRALVEAHRSAREIESHRRSAGGPSVTQKRFRSIALVLLALSTGCSDAQHGSHEEEHAEAEDFERGPHGGRWLADGDFAVELTLFDRGVPPEFRAFVYRDGKPREPGDVSLELTLRRLGGRVERISFQPSGDHLRGEREVEEPHSFDVEVVAREAGREHRLAFASYENRVTLAPEQIESAGIEVGVAGPATIHERVVLNGRITPNEDALAHVMPRFPGVVRSVHKRLGDPVASGDLLAVIESNESLHPYELRARQAGTVIDRNVAPGEFVSSERELFAVADLTTVWVDLDVYRRDFARLRAGQPVRIDAGDGGAPAESTLSYLSPIGSLNTQTLLARAVLANRDGSWRPGLFVTAQVEVAAVEAPVAVAEAAVQRLRDWDVVLLAEGEVFEAQPVVLGRRDGSHVEIESGLAPGQRYAAAGSFVLKAEAGKSGASHDH